jgi:hypothetical protein
MAIKNVKLNGYGDSQFLAGRVYADGAGIESKVIELSANGDGTWDASPETTITSGTNYYVVIKTPEQNIVEGAVYPQAIADNDSVIAVQAGQLTADFPNGHGLAVNDSVELSLTNVFTKKDSGSAVGIVKEVRTNQVTIDFDLKNF